ncbi:MAG TPA: hypothetical protein VEL47_08115, partial [Myxococcota bacterium]|nr:hypothetical protein [Myxococcota bacterium]
MTARGLMIAALVFAAASCFAMSKHEFYQFVTEQKPVFQVGKAKIRLKEIRKSGPLRHDKIVLDHYPWALPTLYIEKSLHENIVCDIKQAKVGWCVS